MSLTAADIKVFASQYTPTSDTDISGGPINSGIRVVFTDIVATDKVEASSTNAGDVGDLRITGRSSTGELAYDTLSMLGTNPVTGIQNFERILYMGYDDPTPHVGTITIRDDATEAIIGTLEPKVSGLRRIYWDATANPIFGSTKAFYEKIFIMNTHPSESLLDAQVEEIPSGFYTNVTFGLENTLQSPQTISNRLAVPTGVSSYGNGPTDIPQFGVLPPLDYQGMWIRMSVTGGTPATNSFYMFKVIGNSI
jgi:hypothetical protein